MALHPLLIGPDEKRHIAALIEKAAANVVPLDKVMALAQNRAAGGPVTMPSNREYTVLIPSDYRVTYTHETQRQCVCRHISISLDRAAPNRYPTPEACEAILEAFGFVNGIGRAPSWLTDDGKSGIVEFIEPLDGNIEQLKRP